MLLCRCVLLCTHLRDLVPRFRRHPFLDLGLESVCVCVCVCVCECFDGLVGIWIPVCECFVLCVCVINSLSFSCVC